MLNDIFTNHFVFDQEYMYKNMWEIYQQLEWFMATSADFHFVGLEDDWMADNRELKLKEDNLKDSGNGEPREQRLESRPRITHRPRINGTVW